MDFLTVVHIRRFARLLRRAVRVLMPGLCVVCFIPPAVRAAEPYTEDAVKAAFLYRFAGYVEWPQDGGAIFTIAVLGTSDVADHLERLLPAQTIKNRPARVVRIRSMDELGDARVLFVSRSRTDDLRVITSSLVGKSVLVVSDDERGLEKGSTLNFVTVDHRVRFEVSTGAAGKSGLKISSELLAVAAKVRSGAVNHAQPCGAPLTVQRQVDCAFLVSHQRTHQRTSVTTYERGVDLRYG